MTYKFEKFKKDYVRGASQISISRANALRFSAKFCKETDIKEFNYVTLFYDKNKKAIGILPTKNQEKESFKITKEKTSASVSMSGFMNAHSLDPKIYHGRYDWSKEMVPGIGHLYVITLKDKK